MAALITFHECWLDPNLFGSPSESSPLSGFPEYRNEHAKNPKTGVVQTNIGRASGLETLQVDMRLLNDTERRLFLRFYRGGFGSGIGFRCRVPYDYIVPATSPETIAAPSGAQAIANGILTTFKLYMAYTRPGITANADVRRICKPVATAHLGGSSVTLKNGDGTTSRVPDNAFKIYFNTGSGDVEQTTGWTVDNTTGIVTFTTPPAIGTTIKWSGEFDIPAAFLPPTPQQQFDITSDVSGIGIREIPPAELGIAF